MDIEELQEEEAVSLRDLINPHERQQEYLHALDTYLNVLYGGARGGGKSRIGRWGIVRRLFQLTAEGHKDCRAGIFCNTFPELRLRQWAEAEKEFPKELGTFKQTEKEFHFHPWYGGHTISFLNLDDPQKYKGAQFVALYIDELTLCADRMLYFDLLACLRWPGVPRCFFSAGTNPDGPGHSWVKGMFVTKTLFQEPEFSVLKPAEFQFVRALPTDNPFLPEEYTSVTLAGMPESKRKPWLEGSWDLFEGQRFQFNPNFHVLQDPPSIEQLEPCRFYRSIDYGFHNPYACGWYAVNQDERGKKKVYKIHEDVRSGLRVFQQIERVLQITEQLGIPENRIYASYLDTACWKEEDDGLSIADKFRNGGISVQQALKDRVAGWVTLEEMLRYETVEGKLVREPELLLYPSCVYTAQQIMDAVWDPKKPGDIMHPEGFRDDALDETRYFCQTHKDAPMKPREYSHDEHQRKVWKLIQKGGRR